MMECDGKNCAGVKECPFHRLDALKQRNKEQFKELEAAIAETDKLTLKLESIDIKSASRKASKKSARKA